MKVNLPERKSQSRDEIISILNKILEKKDNFTLWQKSEDGRLIKQAKIKSINAENNSFVLEPTDTNTKFKNREKIYLKSKEKNLLFKEQLSFASEKLVIVPLPKEFYVEELRKNPRRTYKPNEEMPLVFQVKNKFSKVLETIECNLIDTSAKGLAFYLDSNQMSSLDKDDLIQISRIGNMIFDPKIQAKVVYVRSISKGQNKGKASYRIGVFFTEREIPQNFN